MRTFHRLIICAMSAASLVAASSGADAATVKYYSRQKLATLSTDPAYTYAPTYGAFGACSGGSQSASVSSCTRSDGATVANSFCSSATKTQNCTSITCGTLSSGHTFTGGSFYIVQRNSSIGNAATMCASYAKSIGSSKGVCNFTTGDGTISYSDGGTIATFSGNGSYAAACQ